MPAFGSISNPVDITAQGLVNPALMRDSLKILLSDAKVDAAIVWLSFTDKYAEVTVQTFVEAKAQTDKPFIVCWMGMPDVAVPLMRAAGIPYLRGAEAAVDALAALMRYAEARRNWLSDEPARKALQLPEPALPATAGAVGSIEGQALLQSFNVPTAAARLVTTADEAVAAAKALGYPVVLKIESPDILHKTEPKVWR